MINIIKARQKKLPDGHIGNDIPKTHSFMYIGNFLRKPAATANLTLSPHLAFCPVFQPVYRYLIDFGFGANAFAYILFLLLYHSCRIISSPIILQPSSFSKFLSSPFGRKTPEGLLFSFLSACFSSCLHGFLNCP